MTKTELFQKYEVAKESFCDISSVTIFIEVGKEFASVTTTRYDWLLSNIEEHCTESLQYMQYRIVDARFDMCRN